MFFISAHGTLNYMIRLIFLTLLLFLICPDVSLAQHNASVRSGLHDGYVRLVFDFKDAPSYKISRKDAGTLTLHFDEDVQISLSDQGFKDAEYVLSIKDEEVDGGTDVDISVLADPKYRAFNISNRIIVDIYKPSDAAIKSAKAAQSPQPETAQQEPEVKPDEKVLEQEREDHDVEKSTASAEDIEKKDVRESERISGSDIVVDLSNPEALQNLRKKLIGTDDSSGNKKLSAPEEDEILAQIGEGDADEHDQKPVPHAAGIKAKDDDVEAEDSILEQARPEVKGHIISMTLTETIGIAAFTRADWLWIVMDRPNVGVPPKVNGPEVERFPPFTRQEIEGGVAFRMKIPEEMDLNFYAEGGGLLWRIVMSEKDKPLSSTLLKRSYDTRNPARGAEVLWTFDGQGKILEVPDPTVGDVLKVITADKAEDASGAPYDFVDFNVLHSIVGAAIQPKNDDLEIKKVATGTMVTTQGGLAISRRKDVNRRMLREEVQEQTYVNTAARQKREDKEIIRIFDFNRWRLGGIQALEENQRLLLAGLSAKDKTGQVQDLLTLAKINISNDRGQEAIGFLILAAETMPAMTESIEFRALLGVAYALAGKHRLAFKHLFYEELDPYTEIDYWRAYNLAWLEDWDQAGERMPYDFSVMLEYPSVLLEKIGIKTAEIALRNGYITEAEMVLASLSRNSDGVAPSTEAAISYLKGVAHNLSGEHERAGELWSPLLSGSDDFFRARAGLAMVLQGLQTGSMPTKEAVDRLEGLRFAWRGDELEASISFLLGQQYVEKDLYIRGFTLLREAASLRPDTDISRDITEYMLKAYRDIILHEENLSPIDAASLYEEFRELVPVGEGSHEVIAKLAERMVDADLLERAEGLLEKQIKFRLSGMRKAVTSERLATIYLLDDKPEKAYKLLQDVRADYQRLVSDKDEREMRVLRSNLLIARSLSQQDQPEEALDLLDSLGTATIVSRLRADIAWQAGLWGEAADAIQNLIIDADIDDEEPLTEGEAELVLNRAVALNLAGDRVGVAAMRTQYSQNIEATQKARLFEVVTRPRQTSIIADQQTISSLVEEVDLFREFLNSYGEGYADDIQ